jgi:hypothetical protein
MITNFEEITANLTSEEKLLTVEIISILSGIKKDKPMKSVELVYLINRKLSFAESKVKEWDTLNERAITNLMKKENSV